MKRFFPLVLFVAISMFVNNRVVADEKPAAKPKSAPTLNVEKMAEKTRPSVVVVTFSGRDGKQQGLGTGFIVSPDGLIATNLHVIGEARPISVQLADGRKFPVTSIQASDRFLDLAVIRIDAKDLPALKLADSSLVKQGEPVVAMGNPHGLKHSVVGGVISGTREVEGRQMIQLAMPIEPGNSGGPVIDRQGRVVGVVTMKSLVTENLGFAVQINSLKPMLEKPNPIPIARWLTIGQLDPRDWTPLFGASWQQRAGRIVVGGPGKGFGGRSLCLSSTKAPELPFELAVSVKLNDESGAAGLVFHSDGGNKHYGFYPTGGKLRLTRFEGPTVFTWKVLRDVQSEHYRPGDWNHLKVRVEKDKLLCYVNDHLVIESADAALSAGKVGLAKFRTTKAEFKRFQAGKQIADSQLSPQLIKRINKIVDELPSLEEVRGEQLNPLADSSTASAAILQRRAESLRQRANELQKLAGDVHVRSVALRMAELMKIEEEKIDLLQTALLIAVLDDEEVEPEIYIRQVDRMAADIKKGLPDKADDKARLTALNKYLFAENGFHGSRTDYYHRANSYLNQVIDDREGLPITLSVLYLELGRRLGLNILGVSLPGHFVVKHVPAKGEEQLIDVFEGGKLMSRDDAKNRVKARTGREMSDEDLKAASKKEIVIRMLRNLQSIAEDKKDREAILRYAETVLAMQPDSVPDRGMRAVMRYETGRRDAAIADLDWILEHEPENLDLQRIHQMRDYFRTRKPPRN